MMLAAGVEAAADFDMKTADGLVQDVFFPGQALTQFTGEPAGRRNAQLARVGARTGRDVEYGARDGFGQSGGEEFHMQRRQVSFGHPPEHDILFDRGAHSVLHILPGEIGHHAQLF